MLKLYRPTDAGFGGQNVDSWDHTWEGASLAEALRWSEICHLRHVFDRYFPKDGKILEGGCGIGHFVIRYHRLGYHIEGVDFSSVTIDRLRAFQPGVRATVGDVAKLPYPDNYFNAYYSGGVVEHFEEGPFKALAEARRVLAPGGKLVITVPFLNPLRRASSKVGRWSQQGSFVGTVPVRRRSFVVEPPPSETLQFSEYYFKFSEFKQILSDAGFRIVEGRPFDVEWGEVCQTLLRLAKRGHTGGNGHEGASPAPPAGGESFASGEDASRLKRIWKDLFVAENRSTFGRRVVLDALSTWSGHMLLFVCEPAGK